VRLSKSQKELLEKAAYSYCQHIPVAEEYLEQRGISLDEAGEALLGVVVDPLPSHEAFEGRLAIPYVTPAGVVDIRFRAMGLEEPKYMGLPGTQTRLYNVNGIHDAESYIAICEGELDTIIMHYKVGIPAIGVPGANAWKKHYNRLLQDFETIYVFADGDKAGVEFGKMLSKELSGVLTFNLPEGEDVNSIYLKEGRDYFMKKVI
jgi:DNA primase